MILNYRRYRLLPRTQIHGDNKYAVNKHKQKQRRKLEIVLTKKDCSFCASLAIASAREIDKISKEDIGS